MNKTKEFSIIGCTEEVILNNKKYTARIDTGSTKNSICKSIVKKDKLGIPIKLTTIKQTNGENKRLIIKAKIKLANRTFKTYFNVSNREKMKYPILIGRNLLKQNFIIDCTK